MTRQNVLDDITSKITSKTTAGSLSNIEDGANRVLIMDYIDQEVPFSQWIARISNTSVDTVIKDNLGFTGPVVTNPFNGIISITKTGFFTGKTTSKIQVEAENYNNSGSLYLCVAQQDDVFPNDTIKITMFPKDGSITGTPSFSGLLVKLTIYN
jgi:hypothetical protein